MVLDHNNETLQILKLLREHPEQTFSIRQLALKRNINYKSAYQAVLKLEKEKLITLENYGNITLVSFAFRFHEWVYLIESHRRRNFLRNKTMAVLFKRIQAIKNPFFICVVFGSYAKGTAKKGSDLDLCVIAHDKKIHDEINTTLHITPYPVHYLSFTPEEFMTMLKTATFNVGKEIAKYSIILKGIEQFYELMHHAQWEKNQGSKEQFQNLPRRRAHQKRTL